MSLMEEGKRIAGVAEKLLRNRCLRRWKLQPPPRRLRIGREMESHCGIALKQQRHEEGLCDRIDIGALSTNVLRGLIATHEALDA